MGNKEQAPTDLDLLDELESTSDFYNELLAIERIEEAVDFELSQNPRVLSI